MALENEVIPEVLVSERAATVFKEACQAEGKNLEQSFLRIGAKPGGVQAGNTNLNGTVRKTSILKILPSKAVKFPWLSNGNA